MGMETMTAEQAIREVEALVARTILDQLGGGRFLAMTGARDFVAIHRGLQFRIPKAAHGINKVVITVNAMDTYDLAFYRIRGATVTEVIASRDVYCDSLQDIFTRHTGLYTHF